MPAVITVAVVVRVPVPEVVAVGPVIGEPVVEAVAPVALAVAELAAQAILDGAVPLGREPGALELAIEAAILARVRIWQDRLR